jgi:soluble lytic murein transglycosylase-like protein
MTSSVSNYTYFTRHNSKKHRKSTWLFFLLVTALALTGATHPTFAAGRDALISEPAPASPPSVAILPLETRASPQETRASRHEARAYARAEARAERRMRQTGAESSVAAMVTEAAERHGVPVGLAHAIIKIESGYNCHARSRYGAAGIGQVLPASARAEGVSGNLYNCSTGLEASMRYLKHAVAIYGDGCAAASAYNTGIFGAGRCTGYGRRAMRLAQLYR